MVIAPAPATPYHRLARTLAFRWWQPVLGTLFIVVAGVIVAIAGFFAVTLAALIAGRPEDADGVPAFGPLPTLAASFLLIAALLPLPLLAARLIQRRPAGTLSSVTGRLRRRWLLTCLPVAGGAIIVFLAAGMGLATATGEDMGLGDALAGWGPFAVSMLVLVLVVPLQAAAEEYLTRGWLVQAIGTGNPWLPIGVQAIVFASLHGWGTPWGFADLIVFGAVAGWLTVRTGGLEAAIALHVMNNLIGAGLAAAYGDLTVDETATDMPWQLALIDLPVLLAYAWVILRLARRFAIAEVVPPGSFPSPPAPGIPAPFSPLRPSDEFIETAHTILNTERARLATLLAGVPHELMLVGGSSVRGALTKGDVDLHLRTPPEAFGHAVELLGGVYRVVHPQIWQPTLATFAVNAPLPTGVAVTPAGSEHDVRFTRAWQRLSSDPALLRAYNDLKLASRSDIAAYERHKSAFFDSLVSQ
ncbi:CPBP family intramembrane glutamic endopeptidase [Actinoplanes sp. NPDC048988]|uniref:CPBP family intramembrane glutamic endopeptidase n=1 Tax=Actinoplanes sp. NPDC048988 TaxID=3363901 RepID=UPI003717EB57